MLWLIFLHQSPQEKAPKEGEVPKQVMMIYVMSPDGTLYINDKKRLRFHHSSFLAGAQLDPSSLIPHPSSPSPRSACSPFYTAGGT